MGSAAQAEIEEVRLAALRDAARRRERELDEKVLWGIGIWEQRKRQDFHRYAAEKLTSDAEHPVSENNIHDMQARRNGRRPWFCYIEILLDEVPEFLVWWLDSIGYEEPRKKLPASGDALARSLMAKMRKLGEQGESWIAEAREEARRDEQRERDVKHQPGAPR